MDCRAAEQLVGIEQDSGKFTPSHHSRIYQSRAGSTARTRRFRTPDVVTTPLAGVSYVTTPVFHNDQDDVTGNDYFLLAKSYFDCREYRCAAHTLRDQTGKKVVFLHCYALYLAYEIIQTTPF